MHPPRIIHLGRRLRRSAAFTLVEALVALTIMLMASSALLLSLETSLGNTQNAVDQIMADGMARVLMEEILLQRFREPGDNPLTAPFGPTVAEAAGPGRSLFDDVDDYHNWTASPPQDRFGQPLGGGNGTNALRPANFAVPLSQLARWRQRVTVYFVDPVSLQKLNSGTSYFRCVEVNIDRQNSAGVWQNLAVLKRVVTYVPTAAL